MGILDRFFGGQKAAEPEDCPTAHRLVFEEATPFSKSFSSSAGVVFEDDGETGYFYATDGAHREIFDALHVYNRATAEALEPGEEAYIVWNPARQRAGFFYRDSFHAVFDFAARRGVSRTGFPPAPDSPNSGWSVDGHDWDESLTEGIEP